MRHMDDIKSISGLTLCQAAGYRKHFLYPPSVNHPDKDTLDIKFHWNQLLLIAKEWAVYGYWHPLTNG